jgi:hypothetical protein
VPESSRLISEDNFRLQLSSIDEQAEKWTDKIRGLLTLWNVLGQVKWKSQERMLELAATVQWMLSCVLTVHGPQAESEDCLLPLNRVLGVGVAERAFYITKLLEQFQSEFDVSLRVSILHTLCVHYRSIGMYDEALYQFRRRFQELEVRPEELICDPGLRAYSLAAYGIDLVQRKPFRRDCASAERGRKVLDKCVEWSYATGNTHSCIDTILRQAESRIYSGMLDEGLNILQGIQGEAEKDMPIIRVIRRKIEMVGLARLGDARSASREFWEALVIAKKHSLHDQIRKLRERRRELQKEGLM